MIDLFSLTAMFILFRETLEAAVVVSVLLQLCNKLKMQKLQKWGMSKLLHFTDMCIYSTCSPARDAHTHSSSLCHPHDGLQRCLQVHVH